MSAPPWRFRQGSAQAMGTEPMRKPMQPPLQRLMKRRRFLSGASVSLGLAGAGGLAWAGAGSPDFITAANRADKTSRLMGLTCDGHVTFDIPIPSRGHAAAVSPTAPLAVGFARRPGRFGLVIDCTTGREVARLDSPQGRHFYGHGAFTADGARLLTTENDYDTARGIVGIWDTTDGFRRVGEYPSGGIGPHDILRLPDGGFVIANGGIQTHPDMGRARLNLPSMRPNLTYLDAGGEITDQAELTNEMHHNSIRHLTLDGHGHVVAALQWQGSPTRDVPLVLHHHKGTAPRLLPHPAQSRLKNYAGSIATCPQTGEIAVTGPKGSHVIFFNADGSPNAHSRINTAAGVAPTPQGGLMISCDGGLIHRRAGKERFIAMGSDMAWDNHLIGL